MAIEYIFLFILLSVVAAWLFAWLCLCSLPIIIAYIRKHRHIFAITILTIFTAWTFIGWLAAVLWSLNSDINKEDD